MSGYTTSQVTGLTKIPIKTIQRYIKDYPYAFSEAARKPRKGRRYTAQDVDNILTCRRMLQHHATSFEIEQTLRGALESPALPMVETDNLLHIAEGARQAMIDAEKSAQRANESWLAIETRLQRYSDNFLYVSKMQRALEARMKRYEERLIRILQHFDDEGVIDGEKMLRKIEAEENAGPQPEQGPITKPKKRQGLIDAFKEVWRYT